MTVKCESSLCRVGLLMARVGRIPVPGAALDMYTQSAAGRKASPVQRDNVRGRRVHRTNVDLRGKSHVNPKSNKVKCHAAGIALVP